MGYSRQEYWSGLPCPPPGHLPDPGIKPASLTLAGGFFTTSTTGKPPHLFLQDRVRLNSLSLIVSFWERIYCNNHHPWRKIFLFFPPLSSLGLQRFLFTLCAILVFTRDSFWCSSLPKCHQWAPHQSGSFVLKSFVHKSLCNFLLSGTAWCPWFWQLFSCPCSGIRQVSWWCPVVFGNQDLVPRVASSQECHYFCFYLFRRQQ